MDTNPLFSILTATRNGAKYIKENFRKKEVKGVETEKKCLNTLKAENIELTSDKKWYLKEYEGSFSNKVKLAINKSTFDKFDNVELKNVSTEEIKKKFG